MDFVVWRWDFALIAPAMEVPIGVGVRICVLEGVGKGHSAGDGGSDLDP